MCGISGVIFALVAIMHLWRAVSGAEVIIAEVSLPIWPSMAGGIFALILAIGNAVGAAKCKCD